MFSLQMSREDDDDDDLIQSTDNEDKVGAVGGSYAASG
jgi:hypothetical protein